MRLRSIALLVLALAVVLGTIALRRRTRPAPSTPEGDVVLPTPAAAPAGRLADSLPGPSDVQPTLDRVFEGAVAADPRARPAFVVGDFNGDGATDLALAVRPRDGASLQTINAQSPHFRLQDAAAPRDRAPSANPHVAPGEPLLGVVHGVAGVPWREAGERPAYLVRHAVGRRMRAQPLAAAPDAVRMQVTRAHTGDLIALDREGRSGLILWTGGAYAWFDVSAGGGSGLP